MEHSTFGTGVFASIRRSGIHRTPDRWFGGVAAGYAHRMQISPLLVRAAFVALTFVAGLGLVIYGLSWALLPEADDGRIHAQEALSGRFDGALALAGAASLAGVLALSLGLSIFGVAAPGLITLLTLLAALAVGVLLLGIVLVALRGSRSAPGPGPQVPTSPSVTTAATLPVYQRAPAPPRVRAPGPGRRAIALAFAIVLLASAGMLWAWHAGHLQISYPILGAVGVATIGLGGLIIILGAMGRRTHIISLVTIGALLAGAYLSAMTYDRHAAAFLAWGAPSAETTMFDHRITSLAQVTDIDWDLVSQAWGLRLFLDLPPTAVGQDATLTLPPGVHMDLAVPTGLPLNLTVRGTDAQFYGELRGGKISSDGAVGTRAEGYSIAAGGTVTYLSSPTTRHVSLTIEAPHSSVYVYERMDS